MRASARQDPQEPPRTSRTAFRFVLLIGMLSFFADFTYEGTSAACRRQPTGLSRETYPNTSQPLTSASTIPSMSGTGDGVRLPVPLG